MPAPSSRLTEPLWALFAATPPERPAYHLNQLLRCHRPRIDDRIVFDKLLQLRSDCSYQAIADISRPVTTVRSRRDEWMDNTGLGQPPKPPPVSTHLSARTHRAPRLDQAGLVGPRAHSPTAFRAWVGGPPTPLRQWGTLILGLSGAPLVSRWHGPLVPYVGFTGLLLLYAAF